jgi:hypothetical protein
MRINSVVIPGRRGAASPESIITGLSCIRTLRRNPRTSGAKQILGGAEHVDRSLPASVASGH